MEGLKNIIREIFHAFGLDIHRWPPHSPAPALPLPVPALRPFEIEIMPGLRYQIDPSDAAQLNLFRNGAAHDSPWPELISRFCVGPDSVFFDVGANVGFYSLYILHTRPAIRVYAFEPNQLLVDHIRTTAALNGLSDRLEIIPAGLCDTAGEAELEIPGADSGWASFGPNPHIAGTGDKCRQTARLIPFDQWRRDAGLALPNSPSWVAKIDVEGYEPRVLRGMEEALTARAFRMICIEVLSHTLGFCGACPADIYDFLHDHKYHPFDENLRPIAPASQEARNILFLPE